MPRNGDGSSDNGPIEGHEIVHGTTGDDSLQHTKHVAPMPEGEKGDALPGLSGGGAAAPISSSSEQYGVNEPHKSASDGTSESKKRSEPHHASPDRSSHLEQKFTKLDKDEVDIASAQTDEQERRAREKRVEDAVVHSGKDKAEKRSDGGHADVEMLHGQATLEGDKSTQQEGGSHGGHSDGNIAHDADLLQRKKAEKFGGVNLGDDGEGHDAHANANANGKSQDGHANANGKSHAGHAADQNGNESKQHEGTKAASGQTNGGHAAGEAKKDGNKMNGGGAAHSEGNHEKSHGGAGDVATDADLLQRKKAEKFGGVNLADD